MLKAQNPGLLINDYGMLMFNYQFFEFQKRITELGVSKNRKKMLIYSSFRKKKRNLTKHITNL